MIFAEKKKKILTGITALLLCAFFVAAALWGSAGDAFAASSAQNGVYDAAELLDSSQEDRLKSRLDSYCEKYDCDIAIVTTDDAGGKTSEDYADTYAEDLGMSMKKEDRPGILFLIDMDNRRMQISTSGQAISYYSDSRIDHILDRCYKYIIRDDYYRTCGQFLDGVRDYMGISAARHGRLRAIHINDSKNPLGARKDRHEKIGEGTLGTEAILRVMRHEALRELPFYLETPNELDGYEREIRMLKELY